MRLQRSPSPAIVNTDNAACWTLPKFPMRDGHIVLGSGAKNMRRVVIIHIVVWPVRGYTRRYLRRRCSRQRPERITATCRCHFSKSSGQKRFGRIRGREQTSDHDLVTAARRACFSSLDRTAVMDPRFRDMRMTRRSASTARHEVAMKNGPATVVTQGGHACREGGNSFRRPNLRINSMSTEELDLQAANQCLRWPAAKSRSDAVADRSTRKSRSTRSNA